MGIDSLYIIRDNQIVSGVVTGLIIAFILWVISLVRKRLRKVTGSEKSDSIITQSDKKTKKDESLDLSPLQNSILFKYSELGTRLRIYHIMEHHDISKTEAGHYIDIFLKHELLRLGGHSETGSYYDVTPRAREYLMKLKKSSEN